MHELQAGLVGSGVPLRLSFEGIGCMPHLSLAQPRVVHSKPLHLKFHPIKLKHAIFSGTSLYDRPGAAVQK